MKIGIDIDNVIADSHPAYLSKFIERFGDKVKVGDLVDFYHIEDFIDADPKEVMRFLDSSLHTDEFQITINPVANASLHIQSWIKSEVEIIYISARPESIRSVTTKWLQKHGFWSKSAKLYLFEETPSYSDITYKSDIVLSEHLSLFIEDKKDIATAITSIPVILFDRPWNKGTLPSNITRVSSWDEIDTIVRKL